MSVTLDMVRSQIRDQARLCVAPGRYEIIAAPADGVANVYRLLFRNALPDTLVVAFQGDASGTSMPPPYEVVPSDDPSNGWTASTDAYGQPLVTFENPPDQGTVIGVQYLTTGFTDAELTNYLSLCTQPSDLLTLKAVHAALIPVILADRNLLMLFKLSDRVDDPTEWQRTQLKVLEGLKADLNSQPGGYPEGGAGGYGSFGIVDGYFW